MEMSSCDVLVDEVLFHCIFAIGRGAGMNIQRESLVTWRKVVFPFTSQFICNKSSPAGDPSKPGEERWKTVRDHILVVCEAVGRLGAKTATEHGRTVITPDDLKYAFNKVREQTCSRDEVIRGFLCSEWS